MPLKHYFLVSVAVFALVIAAVHYVSLPALPFAMILLFGETLVGFQLEDHRVPQFLDDLMNSFKSKLRLP